MHMRRKPEGSCRFWWTLWTTAQSSRSILVLVLYLLTQRHPFRNKRYPLRNNCSGSSLVKASSLICWSHFLQLGCNISGNTDPIRKETFRYLYVMTDEASVCTTTWFFIIFFCRHECNSFQKCCFVVVVKCEYTLKATLHVPDSSGSRFAMISRSDHVMYQQTMMAPPAAQNIQRADQEVYMWQ